MIWFAFDKDEGKEYKKKEKEEGEEEWENDKIEKLYILNEQDTH